MLILTLCLATSRIGSAAQFTLQQDAEGVTVLCDGQLFTRYVQQSGAKPILWPIIGPTGKEMTRGYPMREARAPEKRDHEHHRSLWFDHGDVNGVSFWHESPGHGTIQHVEYLELTEGPTATIRTRNAWKTPDGTLLCEDVRTMMFGADDLSRWIDFQVTVTAMQPRVVFGDTKEGSFGLRVGGAMAVDDQAGGRIVNSEGQRNEDAWGKPAAWVDYTGPVDGETVGIAVLNHPSSLRFPSYWHVRTYGLFAANPFGLHDFLGKSDVDGSLALERGASFMLRYRVLLHGADVQPSQLAEAFARYAQTPARD
jgi:hypothetical protein